MTYPVEVIVELNKETIVVEIPKGQKGDPGSSYIESFLIADWIAAGTFLYYIIVTHDLDTNVPNVKVYEVDGNLKSCILDRIEILDNNNIKIFVTYLPDGRFNGSIVVNN